MNDNTAAIVSAIFATIALAGTILIIGYCGAIFQYGIMYNHCKTDGYYIVHNTKIICKIK